jgi:hypothetical protein
MATMEFTVEKMARKAWLNPSQRELVERDLKVTEHALRGRSMHDPDSPLNPPPESGDPVLTREASVALPDLEMLRESHSRDKETLETGTPPTLTGLQKTELLRAIREETERYKEGLLSPSQLRDGANLGVIEQFTSHQNHNALRGPALVQMHRLMEPDFP